jgi:hypothetical protein
MSLNDLISDCPQTFGQFAMDAMKPNIGELDEVHWRELEEILQTRLIVIDRHIRPISRFA